jgi:hypothetical protein
MLIGLVVHKIQTNSIMKFSRPILAIAVFGTLLLSSCASIVSKSTWPVTFSSNPSGAKLKITDKKGREIYNGQTPTTLSLNSSAGFFQPARYEVEATHPGYRSSSGAVSARMNGWYVGNLVFGGLVGILIVDPATGAMFKLPESYSLNLSKLSGVAAKTPHGDHPKPQIVSIHDIPEHMRKNLIALQ